MISRVQEDNDFKGGGKGMMPDSTFNIFLGGEWLLWMTKNRPTAICS